MKVTKERYYAFESLCVKLEIEEFGDLREVSDEDLYEWVTKNAKSIHESLLALGCDYGVDDALDMFVDYSDNTFVLIFKTDNTILIAERDFRGYILPDDCRIVFDEESLKEEVTDELFRPDELTEDLEENKFTILNSIVNDYKGEITYYVQCLLDRSVLHIRAKDSEEESN